jgi:hypothetical protein
MTGPQLCMSQLQLKFRSYCQVAEDGTLCNSLAAQTGRAITMGPSENLSGRQCCLALDTGKMIVRICWKKLHMPLAVIYCANLLGCTKCSILVFIDCLGCVIGNYTPYAGEAGDEDESVVNDLYASVLPVPSEMP